MKKIYAKKLLMTASQPDYWFGFKYTMNLYRGCSHGCIYCDSRSGCYQIEDFDQVAYKENALELLREELSKKRIKGTIGTGSMCDPYSPYEKDLRITERALGIISEFKFPVHAVTKSNLVTRDYAILQDINRTYCAISFTITTLDDELAKIIEPHAPLPSERLKALEILAKKGIYTGVTLMPILPFINDTEENLYEIITRVSESGGQYIIPSLSVTLRDRQRAYFYSKLDENYDGLKNKYINTYREQYQCKPERYDELNKFMKEKAKEYHMPLRMKFYDGNDKEGEQLSLFSS